MHFAFATATAVALLLSACGGADEDSRTTDAPGISGGETSAPGRKAGPEAALKVAAQGYVDALMSGDFAGVTGYLDPKACDDKDKGAMVVGVGAISKTAKGATMKVTDVYVEGDRGGVEAFELSDDASDALRRPVKSSFSGERMRSFYYDGDEWYLRGPCEDESSASPEPSI